MGNLINADLVEGFTYEYAIVKDEKANGSQSGTFTSGAWRTRVFSDIDTNIDGVSLSSNQITLPAGTYKINAKAAGYKVGTHRAKLVNVTDTADVILGSIGTAHSDGMTIYSFVEGVFTITAGKVFELQHRCYTTQTNNGFGGPGALFGTDVEIYAQVEIIKIA